MESIFFYIPFAVYLIALLYIGFRHRSDHHDTDEYLFGSRSLTLPAMVATLVTTWYGGILGVGQFTYLYGITNWFVFGLPYYFFAALYAFVLAPKIRSSNHLSIPEMLEHAFSPKVSKFGALFVFILVSPAPYILMLTILLKSLFNLPFLPSLLIGIAISIAYVWRGGFRSIVGTDKLQFLFMFAGFILILIFAMRELSLPGLWQQLPASHKDPTGGMSWQQLAVWFLIASWTFIDPGFHQRVTAASNTRTARRGILTSIGFWFVFDMLTMTTGLYALVLVPNLADAQTAYPELAAKILPPIFKGVFFCGLLATVMSTIDSFTFLSAITIGKDLAGKITQDTNRAVKYGLIVTALISIVLIYLFPSIIDLWYNIGSLTLPAMLPVLLAAYFPKLRLPNLATLLVMIGSFLLSTGWFIFGQLNAVDGWAMYPLGIEPFFPGLILSVISYIAGKLFRRS